MVHEILDHSFYPSKQYNKLVVLALFFVVGKEHHFFRDLIRSIHDLTIINKNLNVLTHDDSGIADVLPSNMESYYLYNGSLTTPQCNETVRWVVFKEIQEISEEQVK